MTGARPGNGGRRRGRVVLLLRLAAAAAVLALGVLYRHALLDALLRAVEIGWLIVLALPLFVIWSAAAALGWREIIKVTNADAVPPLWRLTMIRIEAQAVNLALPLASVPGEVVKASMIGRVRADLWRGATSVGLDTVAALLAGLLFALAGMGLRWRALAIGPGTPLVMLGLGLACVALLLKAPAVASRIASLSCVSAGSAMGQALVRLGRSGPPLRRALRRSTWWHLAERVLTAGEIWILAYGLGLRLGPAEGLFATAVMTGSTLILWFIPAQAGAAEGGLSLAFAALGHGGGAGLSVALGRRARQLLTAAVGLALLIVAERGRRDPAAEGPDAPPADPGAEAPDPPAEDSSARAVPAAR